MRNNPIPAHALFDFLLKTYKLKNDRALAELLGVTQGALSKIRAGVNKPSADLILRVYDNTTLTITQIRHLLKEDHGSNT